MIKKKSITCKKYILRHVIQTRPQKKYEIKFSKKKCTLNCHKSKNPIFKYFFIFLLKPNIIYILKRNNISKKYNQNDVT